MDIENIWFSVQHHLQQITNGHESDFTGENNVGSLTST